MIETAGRESSQSKVARNPAADRLPGLDGLRAISIAGVIALHCTETPGFPSLGPLDIFMQNGGFGVEMFFVLSGFLITSLLLKEEKGFGSFSVSAFYLRRAIRILPPALTYLTAMLLLGFVGLTGVTFKEWAEAAGFVRNYLGNAWETGHFWSLAVEEQFYFTWPVVLIVLPKRFRLSFAATAFLLAPFWRYANLRFGWVANPFRFDFHYDALLVGCLLAFLRSDTRWLKVLRTRVLQSWLIPAGLVAAFVALNGDHQLGIFFTLRQTLLIAGVALMISYLVDVPGSLTGRVLNSRFLVWVGTLSYSLYLWQQVFCWRHAPHAELLPSVGIQNFPLNVAISFSMAALSYYFIETPARKLKRYIPPREAPSPVTPEAIPAATT